MRAGVDAEGAGVGLFLVWRPFALFRAFECTPTVLLERCDDDVVSDDELSEVSSPNPTSIKVDNTYLEIE